MPSKIIEGSDALQRFIINLLWVRPGKVGGTEVFIRNLMNGFHVLQDDFNVWLFVSVDNAQTFEEYEKKDKRFHLLKAPVKSDNITKRILWQNFFMNRFLRKNGFKYCFSPVYDRPVLPGGIEYVITIHDIQAYHFPEYHPLHEVLYSKMCWIADSRTSKGVVTISDYVADDICKVYPFNRDEIRVIPNPVCVDNVNDDIFDELKTKYKGIERQQYYYTVGQMIPHKNISTLLKVMAKIKNTELPQKLLITGIKGNASSEIEKIIKDNSLQNMIILTGYISEEERNTLYRNARAFLFPSVFEGFGMPPVEAMLLGAPVITTLETSIPEVTQNLANYVNNPYEPDEWIRLMKNVRNESDKLDRSRYDAKNAAGKYLSFLREVWNVKGNGK